MRALRTVLLLLVALGAFALRMEPAPGHRAGERPGAADAPRWLVDDPDAAYHLRRVELALASGRVPRFDRFLNHPEGSPIPWPPLADGLFALVARAALSDEGGDPALGGVDEGELEALLVHVPPALGALAVLAVFAATALVAGPGRGRGAGALVAAAIYAALPVAVWYGGVTRLDHHVVVALLFALVLAACAWALRAEELADATLGALVAGTLCGLAIASWLAAGIVAGLAGLSFFARALDRDPRRSADGARAGILFFAAAAATTGVPAATSAWNAVQPGSLVNLTQGVPRALLAAVVPFAVLAVCRRDRRAAGTVRPGPVASAALALAALAAAVALLPGFTDGVAEGFAWASRENLFMDVVAESRPIDGLDVALQQLSHVVLLFPLALVALAPSALRRPERLLVVAACVVWGAMAATQLRFGNALAVPLAVAVGVALADLARSSAPGLRRAAWIAGAAVPLALAPSVAGVYATTEAEYDDLADWRGEVLGGLRWMRANTPSPGPWNASKGVQDYGVLSAWGLGHLIEYHARRPSIATNFGSFVGEEGFRESSRALLAPEPGELVRRMDRLGARYVVVTPRLVGDLVSLARIAGVPGDALFARTAGGTKAFGPRATGSALWRLALHARAVGATDYPGLELVWAARRRENPRGTRPRRGEPSGPVLSIYERVLPAGDAPAPSLVAPD